jgi:uncharacterized protein YjbJ (UPF0337 family)
LRLASGAGFCRFPGLDPSEAERPSRGSRFPIPGNSRLRDSSKESLAGIHTNVEAITKEVNQSTEDEIKGNVHEAKGTVKEKAGQVINNPSLTAEGQDEKLAGKVQKKVGQVEKVFEK